MSDKIEVLLPFTNTSYDTSRQKLKINNPCTSSESQKLQQAASTWMIPWWTQSEHYHQKKALLTNDARKNTFNFSDANYNILQQKLETEDPTCDQKLKAASIWISKEWTNMTSCYSEKHFYRSTLVKTLFLQFRIRLISYQNHSIVILWHSAWPLISRKLNNCAMNAIRPLALIECFRRKALKNSILRRFI